MKQKDWAVYNADWYQNPQMMGHHWAKDTVKLVEDLYEKLGCHLVKNTTKRVIFSQLIDLTRDDWHFWSQLTKKYLNQISYVLRRIGKETPFHLLYWLNNHSGCLKTQLDWYLELKAYQQNRTEYLDNYCKLYGFYGMSKEDATKRFDEYHQRLKEKHNL